MSVIKPDSVIGCVGENDVYTYSIDAVYDGDKIGYNALSSRNDGGWYPKTPSGDWKTWLIYKFNRPKNIIKINFTFYSLSNSNAFWIAKNIDTSYSTEPVLIPGSIQRTNYNTLNIVKNNTLSNTFSFGFDGVNVVYNMEITGQEKLNNVDNLLFIFEKPVNIIEIECIGENIPLPYIRSEKSELKLRKFKPENYCMFSPSIDNGISPKSVNSIMLIGDYIYFCLYDGLNMVKIIRFNKDGQSLDNIYIENLQDKSKLRETLLKPPTQSTLTFYPSNSTTSYYLYNYPYKGENKTKTEWVNSLRQYRVTTNMIKNLYENGDENIILNQNTTTSVDVDTKLYYVRSSQTDRIFVYNDTNKLVHVTDYIPKGKLYELTLIKTNNTVTSKLVPNIPSSYVVIGNDIKGYSWEKLPTKVLPEGSNNICVAIGDDMIEGSNQNILLAGSVTSDNKCKVWGYDGQNGKFYSREDFRYLNELNDSGLQWINKNNVNNQGLQRIVKYQPDSYFGQGLTDYYQNKSQVCRTNDGKIGSIIFPDYSMTPLCRVATSVNRRIREDVNYDVLYATETVSPTISAIQNCSSLDCNSTDIKNKIVDYYNNQSTFKGKYTMTILNTNKVDDSTCDIEYNYTKTSSNPGGTNGKDFRRFNFRNENCDYELSLFEKTLSGTTLRQIDFPNKISLKTNEGKFCSDTDNGIVCNSSTDGQNETFQVEKILQDKIALKGKRNLYCSDYSSVVDCFSPYKDSWETFNYENLGNNQVSIKSPKTNNYCAYKTDSKSLVCDQPTSSRTDQSKFTYTAK